MSDAPADRYDPNPAMDRLEATLLLIVSTWIEAECRNVPDAERLALRVIDDVHEAMVRANIPNAESPTRKAARKLLRLKDDTQ